MELSIFGTKNQIINTYFPNEYKEQNSYIKSLTPFFYTKNPIIWAGDRNIVTNFDIDRIPKGKTPDIDIIRKF